MNYQQTLQEKIRLVTEQKDALDAELKKLEDDFANVKLNPYGITSIDFAKRQEKAADLLKMEGAIMGLTLALEVFQETVENAG